MANPQKPGNLGPLLLLCVAAVVLAALISWTLEWGLQRFGLADSPVAGQPVVTPAPAASTPEPGVVAPRPSTAAPQPSSTAAAAERDDPAAAPLPRLPDEGSREFFSRQYPQQSLHRAIAVNSQGHWGWSSQAASPTEAARTAQWHCERHRLQAGQKSPCQVVHVNHDWLAAEVDQNAFAVDPELVRRGVIPALESLMLGEYARAAGHKAVATSEHGYYGYATGRRSEAEAIQAALDFCDHYRRQAGAKGACRLQYLGSRWQ